MVAECHDLDLVAGVSLKLWVRILMLIKTLHIEALRSHIDMSYWARTRENPSHGPIPITLGYRSHGEVLGSVDSRDVNYMKTRLKTSSTDQSSRKPPHRKKCIMPIALSATIQVQVAPSLGAPVSSRTIRRRLAEGHLGCGAANTCVDFDAHPSTPPFGMVPRTRKLDCSGIEPGRL
ncbi:HTH_Tnp_Tc3_2 domain-containing protein [Trichonephila clavipes]|nr:HTH_Tnp_Tc3_2 domain-containing protein [Trichonephila clavipes]